MVKLRICKQTETEKKQTKAGPVRLCGRWLISDVSLNTIICVRKKKNHTRKKMSAL